MFRVGENLYGTQFHPELDKRDFRARIDIYRHHGYFPPEEYETVVAAAESAEVKRLKREVAELRRANEILGDRLGVFRSGGARPPTFLIVAYIDEFKVHFGVEQICRVLTEHGITISPSTYYTRSAAPSTATRTKPTPSAPGTGGPDST